MKVCNVVKNSVWFDPRVRKQVLSYIENIEDEVEVIGIRDLKYNSKKVQEYPCEVRLVNIDSKYFKKNRTFLMKLKREMIVNREMAKMITKSKPDIIHANDLNALIPSYSAAKKLRCRLVYDSHEVFVENMEIVKHPMIRYIWMFFERCLINRVDKMVCVSNAAADYFVKTYKIERPLVVTNCSLNKEQCFLGEKNSGFEVLNHGQFYGGRGYDIMVEAIPYLQEYPEIKLAVRGFGSMEKSLRARAEELGNDNFRFYSKVLVQELIPMASRSHVGVAITEAICLNFKLSISNKLFEYASAGLPVIMSDIPEHRYLNDKYHFGIIIPDNKPETFAQAVIKMYTDKEFYRECAENARRLTEEINWENEFKKLIDFEKEMLTQA